MTAHVILDLDSVFAGALGRGGDAAVPEIVAALARAERELKWSIHGGRGTMNRATFDQWRERTALHRELARRGIVTAVVDTRKEAADKDLFLQFAISAGDGVRRHVILSADGDFAQAVRMVRGRHPDIEVAVVVQHAAASLRHAYGADVRFVELATPAPTAADGDPWVLLPTVLVCDVCGQRRLLERALPKYKCPHCGTRMRTGGNIVPHGAIPLDDGPLVQVWRGHRLVKLAVLRAQSTGFVRRECDEILRPCCVAIGEYVVQPQRISSDMFEIRQVGREVWELVPHSQRCGLYRREIVVGHDRTSRGELVRLTPHVAYPLAHGDEIFVNHPERDPENALRIQFISPEA